jgi:hypothetical protein
VTLGQIITYISKFDDLDLANFYGESPTNAEQTALINWAARTFAHLTLYNYNDAVTFTLTSGTAVYDLLSGSIVSQRVIKPRLVTLNSVVLSGPDGRRGLWTLPRLEKEYPTYQTQSSGTPTVAARLPSYKIRLYKKPDATAAAASNNYISGWCLPADITYVDGTSETIDVPVHFHECLAYMAAFKAAYPHATEESMWVRLKQFHQDWYEAMSNLRDEANSAFWGFDHFRGQDNDWLNEVSSM